MSIITTPATIWSAHEQALNDYLEDELGIPMSYPPLRTELGNSPRGNAAIASSTWQVGGNLRTTQPSAEIRIVVCHDDPVEGSLILKDWGWALTQAMEALFFDGLSGTYRGVAIANAFKGIVPTQAIEFQSETYGQQPSSTDSVFNGLVLSRYRWLIEQVELF